jgi:hypothetical protein
MYEEKIRHINIELKIIKLDLAKIAVRLEDNNRGVKEILSEGNTKKKEKEMRKLLDFNRFLLQKHKERIGDKFHSESQLKKLIEKDIHFESKLIENEKRMESFILTIENCIDFNSSHPYYTDSKFAKDLMEAFLKNEDYEKCASLKNHLAAMSTISIG